MEVAKRVAGGFDILSVDTETNTSLVRNKDQVRISWSNSGLVQLVKNEVATADIGTLLVAHGEILMPTGDRQSTRTVGHNTSTTGTILFLVFWLDAISLCHSTSEPAILIDLLIEYPPLIAVVTLRPIKVLQLGTRLAPLFHRELRSHLLLRR